MAKKAGKTSKTKRTGRRSSKRGKLEETLKRHGHAVLAGIAMLFLLFSLLGRSKAGLRASYGAGAAGGSGSGDAAARRVQPEEGRTFYFAYASDLLEERLRKGSSRGARMDGVGSLDGFLFEYAIYSKVWKGGVADLIEVRDPEQKAWGVVWDFPEKDVANLDKQKGVDKADAKYRKIIVDVNTLDGRSMQAFTYVLHPHKRSKNSDYESGWRRWAPSQQYRQCILRGARAAKLPEDYVAMLESIADNGETFKRKSVGTACG